MNKEIIFEKLKSKIIEIMDDSLEDEADITMEASLRELGANSIDRMDIIMDMCDELGVKIPMTEFSNLKNIGEMVELYYEKIR